MLWTNIWFRYTAYGVAWAAGRVRRWFGHALVQRSIGFVLFAVLCCGVAGSLRQLQAGRFPSTLGPAFWTGSLTGTFVIQILVAYVLLLLALGAYLGRQRVVVLAAVNHAGKEFDSLVAGFSEDLSNRLADLKAFYDEADEANRNLPPSGGDPRVAPPGVVLHSTDDSLSSVIDEKSAVKLGVLDVPLRPLVQAVVRMLPSRRLTIGLRRIGDRLCLIADMSNGGGPWRVERDLPPAASGTDLAGLCADMQDELTYRLFTYLASVGSKQWHAVKRFTDGLRAYRRTKFIDIDKTARLQEAADHWFKAREFDTRFTRCSYNLGIVYRDLHYLVQGDAKAGYEASAFAAFEQALTDDPADADAAYAVSEMYWRKRNPTLALQFAERAVAHAPRHVLAWNMCGFQTRRVHADPDSVAAWDSSLALRNTAAALAWRELAIAVWRRQGLDAKKRAIKTPFINLAVALSNCHRARQSIRILRQAGWQTAASDLFFEQAKIMRDAHARSIRGLLKAANTFERALALATTAAERSKYQVRLFESLACIVAISSARCERIIRIIRPFARPRLVEYLHFPIEAYRAIALANCCIPASPSTDLAFLTEDSTFDGYLDQAFQVVGAPDVREFVAGVGAALVALRPAANESDSQRLARLRAFVIERTSTARGTLIARWIRATVAVNISGLLMQEQPGPRGYWRAERLLRWSITCLEKDFPAEAMLVRTYENLADALRRQSQLTEARSFAEKAVARDPFNSDAARQLGLVFFDLADYDRAEQYLQRSYGLNPRDLYALRSIGAVAWNRGVAATDPDGRTAEFRRVIGRFNQALELSENDEERRWQHFWLGRFHGELKDYDLARMHYAIAEKLGGYPLECRFWSGWILLEQELFDEANGSLLGALRQIRRMRNDAPRDVNSNRSLRNWLSTPTAFAHGDIPPAHFILHIALRMALLVIERGRDVVRARRHLNWVSQHLDLLGEPDAGATDDVINDYRDRRREILARYHDYLGWSYFCAGNAPSGSLDPKARTHLEASIRLHEGSQTLYHLARVHLSLDALEDAQAYCDRAKAADLRGVFSTRVAKIEAEIASLQHAKHGASSAHRRGPATPRGRRASTPSPNAQAG